MITAAPQCQSLTKAAVPCQVPAEVAVDLVAARPRRVLRLDHLYGTTKPAVSGRPLGSGEGCIHEPWREAAWGAWSTGRWWFRPNLLPMPDMLDRGVDPECAAPGAHASPQPLHGGWLMRPEVSCGEVWNSMESYGKRLAPGCRLRKVVEGRKGGAGRQEGGAGGGTRRLRAEVLSRVLSRDEPRRIVFLRATLRELPPAAPRWNGARGAKGWGIGR
jgi:hypothetical protein